MPLLPSYIAIARTPVGASLLVRRIPGTFPINVTTDASIFSLALARHLRPRRVPRTRGGFGDAIEETRSEGRKEGGRWKTKDDGRVLAVHWSVV